MKKDTNVSIGDRIKQLREPLGLSQVQLADSISVSKQTLYEYSKWDNFKKVIDKAKEACLGSNNNVSDHFADVGKTIEMPKTATKSEFWIHGLIRRTYR